MATSITQGDAMHSDDADDDNHGGDDADNGDGGSDNGWW